MKPLIREIDKKYIEVIGHYDNPVLCAKMTLLADLYAIEHKEGYALFKVEDYDKLAKIDSKLEFTLSGDEEPSNSITDLTGTKWLLNSSVNITTDICPNNITSYAINCSYDGGTYSSIDFQYEYSDGKTWKGITLDDHTYDLVATSAQANPLPVDGPLTLTITGGTDVTNLNLISWLATYGTLTASQELNKIFFGNSSISKIALGNTKVTKLFFGSVEIYSKATSNGYQVTVTNSSIAGGNIYDGQDSSGTLLGSVSHNETKTFTITSGYIYISSMQLVFRDGQGNTHNPFPITEAISLELVSGGGGNN